MKFKKLISSIAVITATVPATLSVVACGSPSDKDISDQDIVNVIQKDVIVIENVVVGENLADVIANIKRNILNLERAEFINFKLEKFSIISILNAANVPLSNSDLSAVGIINSTLNFKYGTVVGANNNLTINIVKNNNAKIVEEINKATDFKIYVTQNTTVDNANAIVLENTEMFKKALIPDLLPSFKISELTDVKITALDRKPLAPDAFKIIGQIPVIFTYKYNDVQGGSVPLKVNVTKTYTYKEIQNAFKKVITPSNRLPVIIKKTTQSGVAIKEIKTILGVNNKKIFKNLLSPEMQPQFQSDKLGFYDYVYESPINGHYVSNDFFKESKVDNTVFFYIAYNETADVTENVGIYIPITLTITV